MKIKAYYISVTGLVLLIFACAMHNAMALPGYGGVVDSTCADLGYPLAPEFEPQVSGNCHACHDDDEGGNGAGKTEYSRQNFEFFCAQRPEL